MAESRGAKNDPPRYAEGAPAAKRRKLDNPLFDLVTEPATDLDEAASSVVRMLDYEPDDGYLQLLNFLVKAAGCETSVQLIGAAQAAQDLNEACKDYAPATYPLTRRDFLTRFKKFFNAFVTRIFDSGNFDAQKLVLGYVAALAKVQLRSLRHAAIIFTAAYFQKLAAVVSEFKTSLDVQTRHSKRHQAEVQENLDSAIALKDMCLEILNPRTTDSAANIRQEVFESLWLSGSSRIFQGLNDEVTAVRLAALNGLHKLLTSSDVLGYPSFPQREWKRLLEIAQRDVDQKCRLAALRVIATAVDSESAEEAGITVPDNILKNAQKLIFDDSPEIRAASADLVSVLAQSQLFENEVPEGDERDWPLILHTAQLKPNSQAARNLGQSLSIGFRPIAGLLLHDFSKNTTKSWLKPLTVEDSDLPILFDMLDGFTRNEREAQNETDEYLAASLLELLPLLYARYEYSDDYLAVIVRLATLLNSSAIVRRGLDTEYESFLDLLVQALIEHPSTTILNALSEVFDDVALNSTSVFYSEGQTKLQDAFDQILVRESPLADRASQALYLSRWIDISEFASVDFWKEDSDVVLPLARVLGLKGNKEAAQKAVDYIWTKSTAGINALLEIYTVASLNGLKFDPPTVDDAPIKSASKQVLEAARAAGIVE